MKRSGLLLTLALSAWCMAASALPITFISEGTGTGSIGATSFTSNAYRITSTGDTDDRQSLPGVFFIDHLTASIEIFGIGVFDFITPTRTFVNNTLGGSGFSRAGATGIDLSDRFDPVFHAWDMLTSFGPLLTTASLEQWDFSPVDTSGGVLAFNDAQTRGIFQATVGTSVPEPTSASLFGLALLALGARKRARR